MINLFLVKIIEKIKDSLVDFILSQSSFNEQEKKQLILYLQEDKIKKITFLSIILLIWSIIGSIIDFLLIGGGAIFSLVMGINWEYFIPELIFFIVNYLAKLIFIIVYMRKQISIGCALSGALPYIGFILILKRTLSEYKNFYNILKKYLLYLRKNFLKVIFRKR